MTPEMKRLEEILKRNTDDPDAVDIEDEVCHYFFFDQIGNAADREEAWSVFAEHEDIRRRLDFVEGGTETISGWGYRIPGGATTVDEDTLKALVARNISNLRPILPETDDNRDIIDFIDRGFSVEIAPPGTGVPGTGKNELFGALYEAIGEFWQARFPDDEPHYDVLLNWAIYLTKCDEVAVYLLWPCLSGRDAFPADMFEPCVGLWKLGCRSRFWVKRGDFSSRTVYVKPPWMDAR